MSDVNQYLFLEKFKPEAKTILEIGSKIVNPTHPKYRDLFPTAEYIGLDMDAGDGVDIVGDVMKDTPNRKFDLVLCISMLEHHPKPWEVAKLIESRLKRGGSLFVSVPWVWRYHPYPDDYYRFSFSGIKALFPKVDFEHCYFASNKPGDIRTDSLFETQPLVLNGIRLLSYTSVNMLGVKK